MNVLRVDGILSQIPQIYIIVISDELFKDTWRIRIENPQRIDDRIACSSHRCIVFNGIGNGYKHRFSQLVPNCA